MFAKALSPSFITVEYPDDIKLTHDITMYMSFR